SDDGCVRFVVVVLRRGERGERLRHLLLGELSSGVELYDPALQRCDLCRERPDLAGERVLLRLRGVELGSSRMRRWLGARAAGQHGEQSGADGKGDECQRNRTERPNRWAAQTD